MCLSPRDGLALLRRNPATEGVGSCNAGAATCLEDGGAYGSCVGQVLPAPEDCLLAGDEDCSGYPRECTGVGQWQNPLGGEGSQAAAGVATWNGGAVVTGVMTGKVDFGGGELMGAGGEDVFVASFDANGLHLWSRRFGDASEQTASGVAVTEGGGVIVAGTYSSKMDVGTGALLSAGLSDVFVVQYDVS